MLLLQMFSLSKQVIICLIPANYKAKHAYNNVATRIINKTPNIGNFFYAMHFIVIIPYL